jgi:hypothetical protein
MRGSHYMTDLPLLTSQPIWVNSVLFTVLWASVLFTFADHRPSVIIPQPPETKRVFRDGYTQWVSRYFRYYDVIRAGAAPSGF